MVSPFIPASIAVRAAETFSTYRNFFFTTATARFYFLFFFLPVIFLPVARKMLAVFRISGLSKSLRGSYRGRNFKLSSLIVS